MRLRNAVPRDANVLTALALRSKGHWGYPESFLDTCRAELTVTPEELESDRANYVVAETDGVVTGFYGVKRTDGASYELEALFVEPSLTGTGIGRLLLAEALKDVFNRGGSSLVVQSDPNAAAFYRACGGREIGRRESDSIPGRYLPLFLFTTRDVAHGARQRGP